KRDPRDLTNSRPLFKLLVPEEQRRKKKDTLTSYAKVVDAAIETGVTREFGGWLRMPEVIGEGRQARELVGLAKGMVAFEQLPEVRTRRKEDAGREPKNATGKIAKYVETRRRHPIAVLAEDAVPDKLILPGKLGIAIVFRDDDEAYILDIVPPMDDMRMVKLLTGFKLLGTDDEDELPPPKGSPRKRPSAGNQGWVTLVPRCF
ncbi:MAG: hypothetical protein ACJ8C0_06770, partial [Microvirga sp.]